MEFPLREPLFHFWEEEKSQKRKIEEEEKRKKHLIMDPGGKEEKCVCFVRVVGVKHEERCVLIFLFGFQFVLCCSGFLLSVVVYVAFVFCRE